ncbi:sortase domain-containing protein [Granulicoccus sp. GXG6511]|uniref:sortase domain-containing protein n=1 Tax=Granulicoccus sp. GXG6511 TaxID=3381351 RepID=UPI003D7DD801
MTDQLADDRAPARPPRRPPRRKRIGVRGLVLALIGLLVVGWFGWHFLVSAVVARVQYSDQINELRTQWELGEPPPLVERPPAGQAYAILTVPKWGEGYAVPIIAGTEPGNLARGVGAYASSVRPGQLGNLALAGYRTSHGAPFGKLLELDKGDQVVIETRAAVFTYVIDVPARDVTVGADDAWILDPVPGTADEPTRPTLTLTTSQDLVWSNDRSVAFGHLGSTRNK